MAVSVLSAAGVVTTQKAAALPPTPNKPPIVVDYKVGTKYAYTSKQFNFQWTWHDTMGKPKHFEAATGGAAYSSISASRTQSGANGVIAGTYWKLNLNGADWKDVKGAPCKVTIKVNYHIAANGATSAKAGWGGSVSAVYEQDSVSGQGSVQAKSAVKTQTFSSAVYDFFYQDIDGNVYGYVTGWANTDAMGAGEASAALVCSSIVLEFPAS